jgi:hypothetical protein
VARIVHLLLACSVMSRLRTSVRTIWLRTAHERTHCLVVLCTSVRTHLCVSVRGHTDANKLLTCPTPLPGCAAAQECRAVRA